MAFSGDYLGDNLLYRGVKELRDSIDEFYKIKFADGGSMSIFDKSWQKELVPDSIKKLDVHHKTDETFLLMKGEAVLIAAEIENGEVAFEVIYMKQGVLYNIPKGLWHNITMRKGAEISITEDANTH